MATLKIAVTKAGNKPIEVNPDELPDEVYKMCLEAGIKHFINQRMSKITTKDLEGEQLAAAQAAAMKVAEENLTNLKEGKVRRGRAGATDASGKKVPGVVMTEARRLAKEVVKNELRAAGIKISHVEASEITKAANELIAADPAFVEQAKTNIEARSAKVTSINIASLVHVSPKLVEKAEKAKAEKKSQLSAKQAGKVAPRKAKAGEATA